MPDTQSRRTYAIEERPEHHMYKTQQSMAQPHNMMHTVDEGRKKDAGRPDEGLAEMDKRHRKLEF